MQKADASSHMKQRWIEVKRGEGPKGRAVVKTRLHSNLMSFSVPLHRKHRGGRSDNRAGCGSLANRQRPDPRGIQVVGAKVGVAVVREQNLNAIDERIELRPERLCDTAPNSVLQRNTRLSATRDIEAQRAHIGKRQGNGGAVAGGEVGQVDREGALSP